MMNTPIANSPARLKPVSRHSRLSHLWAGVWLAALLGAALPASAQALFAKPEAAANALIDAIAANDGAAMARVLGNDWKQLIPKEGISSQDVLDFLEKASQSRKVEVKDGRGELVVGTDPFTLPIPLAQAKDGQWRFDIAAGREAIAERQIGANERAAMQVVLAYLDAQREYATLDRNGDGVLEYAQKLVSSPGQRDGLIWSRSLGDESPLGEGFAPVKPGAGYHGYRFKILTAQGPKAAGGARNYIIGQRMRAGFAMLAWPVKYGETGIMSFMVNGDGVLEYAQKLVSSPGQRDGLIWSRSLGDESPLGEGFAPVKPGAGYHGYRFKILTAQGPAAKGGARSYFIGPRMTAGFALLAWPVSYGKTGVMSFMVSSDGAVFECNLGPQSAQVAAGIKAFNPEEGWTPTQP